MVLGEAAILLERLAGSHPLPDGNKRISFFLTGLFLEANGSRLHGAEPDVDVPMVERIAAGQVEQQEILAWLSKRTARVVWRSGDKDEIVLADAGEPHKLNPGRQ
jgi:prophage maintenance system killer protein